MSRRAFFIPVAVGQAALLAFAGVVAGRELSSRDLLVLVAAVGLVTAVSQTSVSYRNRVALLLVLTLTLFTQPLVGGQNGAPVRPEDALMVALAGLFFVAGTRLRVGEIERGIAVLAGAALLAMLVSSFQESFPASWSDLFFFVRLVKYALFAVVGRELAIRIDPRSENLLFWVSAIFGVFAVIGIAQYYGYGPAISHFGSASPSRAALLTQGVSWRRAIGTVGNANYFGYLCAVGLALSATYLLHCKSWIRRAAVSACSSVLIGGVLVSGSRTAVFAALVMTALVIVSVGARPEVWRNAALTLATLGAALPVAAGAFQHQPILDRFRFLWSSASQSGLGSLSERRAAWSGAFAQLRGHWIFGLGPGKGVLIQWVDNDVIRILRDFGALGAGAYVALAAAAVLAWIKRPAGPAPVVAGGFGLAATLVVGTVVMGAASDVFYETQVMGVIFILLGVLTAPSRVE